MFVVAIVWKKVFILLFLIVMRWLMASGAAMWDAWKFWKMGNSNNEKNPNEKNSDANGKKAGVSTVNQINDCIKWMRCVFRFCLCFKWLQSSSSKDDKRTLEFSFLVENEKNDGETVTNIQASTLINIPNGNGCRVSYLLQFS